MTSAEVDELSAGVDVSALWAYWDAVGARTIGVVRDMTAEDLEPPVDRAHLRRVVNEEGILAANGAWVEEAWATFPSRGAYLAQLALCHHWGHLYEMGIVRAFLGHPGR